jgi:hypothetical protein
MNKEGVETDNIAASAESNDNTNWQEMAESWIVEHPNYLETHPQAIREVDRAYVEAHYVNISLGGISRMKREGADLETIFAWQLL